PPTPAARGAGRGRPALRRVIREQAARDVGDPAALTAGEKDAAAQPGTGEHRGATIGRGVAADGAVALEGAVEHVQDRRHAVEDGAALAGSRKALVAVACRRQVVREGAVEHPQLGAVEDGPTERIPALPGQLL